MFIHFKVWISYLYFETCLLPFQFLTHFPSRHPASRSKNPKKCNNIQFLTLWSIKFMSESLFFVAFVRIYWCSCRVQNAKITSSHSDFILSSWIDFHVMLYLKVMHYLADWIKIYDTDSLFRWLWSRLCSFGLFCKLKSPNILKFIPRVFPNVIVMNNLFNCINWIG